MLSAQEISTLRSPDMWRVNRMTPGLGLLAKHPVGVNRHAVEGSPFSQRGWTVV
jgi:hypothetical protein